MTHYPNLIYFEHSFDLYSIRTIKIAEEEFAVIIELAKSFLELLNYKVKKVRLIAGCSG